MLLASSAVSFQKRFAGLQLSCFSPKFAHAPQVQFSCFSGQHSHAFEVEFSCFSCFSLADLSSFVGTVDTFYHCLADTAQSWEPFPLSTSSSSGFEHLLKQTKICFDIYFILKHFLPCDAYSGISSLSVLVHSEAWRKLKGNYYNAVAKENFQLQSEYFLFHQRTRSQSPQDISPITRVTSSPITRMYHHTETFQRTPE